MPLGTDIAVPTMKLRIMRRKTARPGRESLTNCQVNTTRVASRRIMRRKTAGPGSESLTSCQVNTTRVAGRRIMRRDTTSFDTDKSLTVC